VKKIAVNTTDKDTCISSNAALFKIGEPMIYWLKFEILERPICSPSCFRKGTILIHIVGNTMLLKMVQKISQICVINIQMTKLKNYSKNHNNIR